MLLVFNIGPMISAFRISLTNYDMARSEEFVGLNNYVRIFSSQAFANSLRVSAVYVFGTVVPVWFISFGLALALSRVKFFVGGWRTLLFLPTVLPLMTVTWCGSCSFTFAA